MIRLLIGGSPCQHWSIAATHNRETQAEGIGWELFKNYLIAKEKWNPDYFLYENNKSAAEPIKAQIRKELGVHEKIQDVEQLEGQLSLFDEDFDNGVRFTYINSALVSAQNRQRFYVTNFGDIEQPKDRGILLKDVLDGAVALREKSITIDANYYKGGSVECIGHQSHDRLMGAVRIPDYGTDKSRPVESTYASHSGCGEGSLEQRMFSDNRSKQQVDLIAEPIPLSEREMDYMVRDSKGNYSDRFSYTQKPAESDKALCITANISKGVPYNVCAEPICVNSKVDGVQPSLQDRIYDVCGKMTAQTTWTNPNIAEPIRIGTMPNPEGIQTTGQGNRVYSSEGKAVPIATGKTKTGYYAEPVCIAERGRYSDDRTEQHLEARTDGKTNTLTTVDKDNRIALPINVTSDGKASTMMAGYSKYGTATMITNEGFKGGATAVAEPVNITKEGKSQTLKSQYCKNNTENFVCYTSTYGASGVAESIPNLNVPEATSKGYAEIECGDCVDMQHLGSKNRRGRSMKNKSNAMQTTNDFYQYIGYAIEFDESGKPVKAIGKNGKEITIYEVKDGKITIKDKQYPIKLVDGYYIIRKLTVSECKRLQTVPDWYEFPVSDSQAYKQLGNGWTVEVIKHLPSHIPHIQEEEIEVLSMYDGMSCGQIALKELGCNVVKYTAYEIDKYAIQTTQHNFPNTIQKGDAFAVRDEDWSI